MMTHEWNSSHITPIILLEVKGNLRYMFLNRVWVRFSKDDSSQFYWELSINEIARQLVTIPRILQPLGTNKMSRRKQSNPKPLKGKTIIIIIIIIFALLLHELDSVSLHLWENFVIIQLIWGHCIQGCERLITYSNNDMMIADRRQFI